MTTDPTGGPTRPKATLDEQRRRRIERVGRDEGSEEKRMGENEKIVEGTKVAKRRKTKDKGVEALTRGFCLPGNHPTNPEGTSDKGVV